jgi:hypothetical protein
MVVSFTISFSVMWWQRKTAELPASGSSGSGIPAREASGDSPNARSVPQPVASSGKTEAPRASPSRSVAEAPGEYRSSNDDGPPLPVMFNIVRTTAYVSDDNREGAKILKGVYEGIATSESETTLDITVTELDLPTMQTLQIQFSLEKGTQKHFGVTDGLAMQSGRQVTLRSPSYRDITKLIP